MGKSELSPTQGSSSLPSLHSTLSLSPAEANKWLMTTLRLRGFSVSQTWVIVLIHSLLFAALPCAFPACACLRKANYPHPHNFADFNLSV